MTHRPIASLTPTLLARKGGARPAMRAQLQPIRQFQDNAARQLEDLGWNDMGADHDEPGQHDENTHHKPIQQRASVQEAVAVEAAETRASAEIVALKPGTDLASAHEPEVVRQQDALAEEVERIVIARRSALADGRRAAFTLRLDAERHLKLRLACVTSGRSAQQIVTEALDRLIADLPDVAELAAKVRKRPANSRG